MTYITHADLGGQEGHGPVRPEPEGQPFHADWEPMALALALAMGATGSWNIDMSRAARETLPAYGRLSYFQIWLAALERLMIERGLVFEDELAQGRALHPPAPVARVLAAANVATALAKGSPTLRPQSEPAQFQPGQRVRAHSNAVDHHTRLPRYVQGKCGVVETLHGTHVFADSHAHGLGECPQPLYTVVFDGGELWGAGAAPGLRVSVDAWQSYLEAA